MCIITFTFTSVQNVYKKNSQCEALTGLSGLFYFSILFQPKIKPHWL